MAARVACALHPRAGLTSALDGDAQVTRAMIESAATVVVLADSTKYEMVAPHAVAELREIDLLITDAAPTWVAGAVREVVNVTITAT